MYGDLQREPLLELGVGDSVSAGDSQDYPCHLSLADLDDIVIISQSVKYFSSREKFLYRTNTTEPGGSSCAGFPIFTTQLPCSELSTGDLQSMEGIFHAHNFARREECRLRVFETKS